MEAGHTGIIFSTQAGTSPKTQARRRNSCDWLAGGRTIAVQRPCSRPAEPKNQHFFAVGLITLVTSGLQSATTPHQREWTKAAEPTRARGPSLGREKPPPYRSRDIDD